MPLEVAKPQPAVLAEQAPTYMGNYDDKKGNPIFSTRFMVKAHLSNKYSHHILLESLQLFSMFFLFILFYSRPRTEASQCHHWLSTLPELWKVIKLLRKMFGTIVRPEFYQGPPNSVPMVFIVFSRDSWGNYNQ